MANYFWVLAKRTNPGSHQENQDCLEGREEEEEQEVEEEEEDYQF